MRKFMRFIGSLLFFSGLIILLYTGINYLNQTETFSFLGLDILVSEGDLTPVIASGIVMLVGALISYRW